MYNKNLFHWGSLLGFERPQSEEEDNCRLVGNGLGDECVSVHAKLKHVESKAQWSLLSTECCKPCDLSSSSTSESPSSVARHWRTLLNTECSLYCCLLSPHFRHVCKKNYCRELVRLRLAWKCEVCPCQVFLLSALHYSFCLCFKGIS